MPRWAKWLWGAVVVLLNAFTPVYLVAFSISLVSLFAGNGFGTIPGVSGEPLAAAMFGSAIVLLPVTLIMLGASLLHMFLWSGLAPERKGLWAVILLSGAQPAMLAYWHVVLGGHDCESVATEDGSADSTGSKFGLAVLGFLSALPMLWFGVFFVVVLVTFVVSLTGTASEPPPVLMMLPAGQMVLLFLWFGLEAFYLVHVYRSRRLHGWNRALWAAVVGWGGPLGWPVYWYLNVWSKPKPTAPTTTATLRAGELKREST